MLSPLAGAQILRVSGWRAIFVALAVLSFVVLASVCWRAAGSLAAAPAQDVDSVYGRLLKDRRLVGYALVNAFVFAAMFAYISGSPFVLQTIHGLSAEQYSVVFAVNASGLVAAAQASGRLVRYVRTRSLLAAGVIGAAGGGVALLVSVATGAGLWPLLASLFAAVRAWGWCCRTPSPGPGEPRRPRRRRGGSARFRPVPVRRAGRAAGGVPGGRSAMPMAAVIAGLGVAGTITLAALVKPDHSPTHEEVHHD